MSIANPALLKEIEERCFYFQSKEREDIEQLLRESIEYEALSHSESLEVGHTKRRKREERVQQRCVRNRLYDAWDVFKKRFDGTLKKECVLVVANKIDDNLKVEDYRNDNVRITGTDIVMPPRGEKVNDQMEVLLETVNDIERCFHTIDRAILLHLHFARIHPLPDGNGRTARLLQNLILSNEGYPPALITLTERGVYQNHLREAMRGYREREDDFSRVWQNYAHGVSDREREFFDYMGGRILDTANREVREIQNMPHYTLVLEGHHDTGYVMKAKAILQNFFRSRQQVGQVRLREPKRGVLEIRGNINRDTLIKLLETNGYSKYQVR